MGVIFFLFCELQAMQDYRCSDVCLCDEQGCGSVSSINDAFKNGELEGHLRVAYIRQNNDATTTPNTYASALGGELKYETANYYHTSVAVSMFVSQKISPLSGDFNKNKLNLDFFDSDGSSAAYLGEAYINYNHRNLDIRIGRQKLDTPLNDRDDIRMLPNTFEAATIGYGGIKDFVFMAGYITAWAGYDSGQDISKFKDMPGEITATGEIGKYVILAGIMNKSIENLELQAWYYGFDKQADLVYFDAQYETAINNDTLMSFGVQYAHYQERSSSMIDGNVYGGTLGIVYGVVGLNLAYNNVTTPVNKTIIIGYGGGPYFTSMEEMTIDSINNATAYVGGLEFDLSKLLVKDLGFSYAFGHFDGKDGSADVEFEEHDFIASYTFSEKLDFEASYALVNDKKNSAANDGGYKRTLVRLNYYF
ncbi:OprD family outer membrane porin [Sulfurimonas sp.]